MINRILEYYRSRRAKADAATLRGSTLAERLEKLREKERRERLEAIRQARQAPPRRRGQSIVDHIRERHQPEIDEAMQRLREAGYLKSTINQVDEERDIG